MPIRVLLADDSDAMLSAMRQVLQEEAQIIVVGEASTFAATMQMIADFKPEVLLLDLHMAGKSDFATAFVKFQLGSVEHILAVSFASDDDAKALAASYGAETLLDKINLYTELIPAIMRCCSNQT